MDTQCVFHSVYFNPRDPDSLPAQTARLERCLDEVRLWLVQNKLKLNEDKTELTVFVSAHLKHLVDELHPTLRIGDSMLFRKDCVRNLGVLLDSELSMRPYINQVTRSVYCYVRSISRIRRYLDDQACATAVHALVVSRLDYANSLLAGVPDCALRKLQLAQNSAARLVTKTGRREHITPVLKQLHWLPMRQRISYKLMSLTFQALNSDCAPEYLKDMLHRNQRRQLRSNSSVVQLLVPQTNIGERSFAVCAPRLWNTLPVGLRNSSSHGCFKKGLKTFLFTQHFC